MNTSLASLAKSDPAEFLHRVEQGQGLPALGPLTSETITVFWRRGATMRELEAALEADEELSRWLVETSNRTYFQALFKATSLRQALARMGFGFSAKTTLTMSLSRDLLPLMPDKAAQTAFFERALCRAVTAEVLEDYLRCLGKEEAFVLGFAWGVGSLLWRPILGQAYGGACPLDLASLDECLRRERLHAGVDHLQLAASALRCWGFPREATACLMCAEEAGPEAVSLRACCEVADLFTRLLFSGFQDVPALFARGRQGFDVEADELGDVLLAAVGELARVTESLVADMDLQHGLRELLRKAGRSVAGLADAQSRPERLPSFDSLSRRGREDERVLEAVAHEVRNPLMAVAGFARKLVETVNPTSRESEYARVILEEGQRLEDVLARMRSGPWPRPAAPKA